MTKNDQKIMEHVVNLPFSDRLKLDTSHRRTKMVNKCPAPHPWLPFWRHAEAGAQLLSNTVQEQKSTLTIGFTWANDGKIMIN